MCRFYFRRIRGSWVVNGGNLGPSDWVSTIIGDSTIFSACGYEDQNTIGNPEWDFHCGCAGQHGRWFTTLQPAIEFPPAYMQPERASLDSIFISCSLPWQTGSLIAFSVLSPFSAQCVINGCRSLNFTGSGNGLSSTYVFYDVRRPRRRKVSLMWLRDKRCWTLTSMMWKKSMTRGSETDLAPHNTITCPIVWAAHKKRHDAYPPLEPAGKEQGFW